jgi:non-ribosomal peptide synthetase-like protein
MLRGPIRPDLLREECLGDILRATARRIPDHPALIWGERTVSYAELDARSDAVARQLVSQGAVPGAIIGLQLPRGADLLIAQAGVAKSGAAWLPLDAKTPAQRVETCLRAAGACGIIASRESVQKLDGQFYGKGVAAAPRWCVEDLLEPAATGSEEGRSIALPRGPAQPSSPAYTIYTSGSTGQPKGIVINHRSICHFLRSENEVLGIREDDLVYQGFSVAFDMSFEEIWISYLVGATLWIAPADCVGDPERIAAAVSLHRISVMHAVPTLMGLIDDPLPSVRLINLGGEACPEALVERLARPGRQLFNTYGPTEATVSASLARLQPGEPVTIGEPLPNYGLLVVDAELRPLPPGETGELCIFGPGVAQGYLGQPELTAERFVANPLAKNACDARMYRTGDLGRIDAAGQLHYLGRADDQVKIRGFRVELGEIEAALAAEPGVGAAAVTLRPLADLQQLVAFVTSANGSPPRPLSLRKALSLRLPGHMIPAHFEIMAELPRLTSGKVNRKALAAWPLTLNGDGDLDAADHDIGLPRSEEEIALHAALRPLFPGQKFRGDFDFFDDLGGHSLLVARLVSALRTDRRYATLGIQDVYREPRLEQIAARMRQLRQDSETPTTAEKSVMTRSPVPWARRWLCGAVQAAVIPWLMVLHISAWLFPFFVYHYFTGDPGDSVVMAAAWSVAAFLLAEVGLFPLAIAGKWLVAGRLKPGRYPLWGMTYFRWWLADRLCELPRVDLLSGTPLLCWFLRALGAKIGKDVIIDSVYVRAPDLLRVDAGASIGTAVHVGNAGVEQGKLVLGPVHVGREAVIDSYAVLQNDTSVGDYARLGGLSALPAMQSVPDGENWEGSPARRVDRKLELLPPRPRVGMLARLAQSAYFVVAGMAVAAMFFMIVFPGFILIDWIDTNDWTPDEIARAQAQAASADSDEDSSPDQAADETPAEDHTLAHHYLQPGPLSFAFYFGLSIPASLVLVATTILLAAGLRRLLLRRQKAGIFSLYGLTYCRTWLLSRVLDSSMDVLHGVYASMFASSWLRLLGAKVGRHAEISTAVGIVPDLLTLGDDTFVADGVMLGDEEQRGGWMVLRPTIIGNRTFLGNGAYVADGATVPDDVLIGVMTRTPDNPQLQSGQTWMGSPPLMLKARERMDAFPLHLTFRPSWLRKFGRGLVESLRIVLPLAFVIASGYLIVQIVMPIAASDNANWFAVANALAVAGMVYGLGSFLLVVALKWILVGRYRPCAAPMWTPFVWLSEAVTNLYESLAVPSLLAHLRGTPLLPWALRLLGARIGRGVYMDTTDLTEFDCVRIGDEAELNGWCGPQTHLFEDRVMKIGTVEIGARATLGESSTVLYDTVVGEGVMLGPLTLVAKGERLPPETRWEGAPAGPC